MKKLLRTRGLVERGDLLERGGGEGSKLFHQFSLRKACFQYYWNAFFCLIIIHTCCNQQVYPFM